MATITDHLPRLFATLLLAVAAVGCDTESPDQMSSDQMRVGEISRTDALAVFEVELDGDTRQVEVPLPEDGEVFTVRDGEAVVIEVAPGPVFRSGPAAPWTDEPSGDALTLATTELVLGGGLDAHDGDRFRAGKADGGDRAVSGPTTY